MATVIAWAKQGKREPRPVAMCPFGCQKTTEDAAINLNDRGYCRHLIGWTSNGYEMFVRESHALQGGDESFERLSNPKKPHPVEEGDVVLETRGPDKRVYRQSAEAPFPFGTYAPMGKPLKKPKLVGEDLDEELKKLRAERDAAMAKAATLEEEKEAAEAAAAEWQGLAERQTAPNVPFGVGKGSTPIMGIVAPEGGIEIHGIDDE